MEETIQFSLEIPYCDLLAYNLDRRLVTIGHEHIQVWYIYGIWSTDLTNGPLDPIYLYAVKARFIDENFKSFHMMTIVTLIETSPYLYETLN